MRIGFDGKRATNNLTGLGNYSRALITALARYFPEHEYLVFASKAKKDARVEKFIQNPGIEWLKPFKRRPFWRSFGIIRDLLKNKIVLFHGLSQELPFALQYTRIKSVVTIHDLIFIKFPPYYKLIDRKIYTFKSRYACRHADKVIAISECTKRDIMQYYRIPEEKIEVIYQSCDTQFKQKCEPQQLLEVSSKYNLPQQYLLYVGTLEARKNANLILEALHGVDENYHVVLVGKPTDYMSVLKKSLQSPAIKARVHFLHQVDFVDLPAIYQQAKMFIYPSFYEGFGIPIIEALHSNIPVIAATGSCLEEAGGPDSLYIAPMDAPALAAAITQIIENPELEAHMKQQGVQYVQGFEEKLLAQQLMDLYKELTA